MAQSFCSLPPEDRPSERPDESFVVPLVNGISIRKSCDDDDDREWLLGFLFHGHGS